MVEVADSGKLTSGAFAEESIEWPAPRLVRGLPDEFVAAILEGFFAVHCAEGFVAGNYRIDRGAYDEVESSQNTFSRAAGLLRCVLGKLALGQALESDALALWVESWDE